MNIITSKYFDIGIICFIILNSIFLGISDYENPDDDSFRNNLVSFAEPFFIVIFAVECILKVIALGFILQKGTYLREAWNWLDFFVVLTSVFSLFPRFVNVSVIRTFRLFRPLRSFSSLPAMKSIVSTMIKSLTKLGEIMVVASIFFFIYSVLGVSLWAGDIHYRCRETLQPVGGDWVAITDDVRV